jgi:hypothetical protein
MIEESKILSQHGDGLDDLVHGLQPCESTEESIAKIRHYYDNYANQRDFENNEKAN